MTVIVETLGAILVTYALLLGGTIAWAGVGTAAVLAWVALRARWGRT